MKTQVKKIDNQRCELTIQVEGDIVSKKFEEVYKKINKEAKVDGFRPGNVPQEILEKNYAQAAQQDVLRELLPEVYGKALTDNSLEPVAMPEISDVKLEKESLNFKAQVEIKPKIELKNYKGLKVEYQQIKVDDPEIEQALLKLKQSYKDVSDQDLAHNLAYPNMDALKETLKQQIHLERSRQQQIKIENSILDQLFKQVNFQAPKVLIDQQLESLVKQGQVDLALRGIPKEQIEKEAEKLKENLKPQAEKQVRTFLVLEEVARKENIERGEKMSREVFEFLLRQANWNVK